MLTSSPSNVETQAETVNLLRLYVRDTIRTPTLEAHTVVSAQEEDMPQSSSKRGRECTGDTKNTGASSRRTQPAPLATGKQLPPQDPPAAIPITVPEPLAPQHIREEASIAFLANSLLPVPDKLELNQMEALLALLVGGEWAASILTLLSKPFTIPKASAIWAAWKPHLIYPSSHPTGEV